MNLSTSSALGRAIACTIACAVGIACSGKKAVQPDAFIIAQISPGSGSASACGYGFAQNVVQIGEPTQPEPQTYSNGDYQNGTVNIQCRVDASGSNFNVQLFAEVNGIGGGSLSASGTVNPQAGTSNLTATFQSPTLGSAFAQNTDCTITFTYNNMPVPVNGSPIASGRIWGHLDCPAAMQSGTQQSTEDGGYAARTCDASADFLFQNCN